MESIALLEKGQFRHLAENWTREGRRSVGEGVGIGQESGRGLSMEGKTHSKRDSDLISWAQNMKSQLCDKTKQNMLQGCLLLNPGSYGR